MGRNSKNNPNVQKQQKNNPSSNRASGRRSGQPAESKPAQRQKNVGHGNSEEHSRTPKGNRG